MILALAGIVWPNFMRKSSTVPASTTTSAWASAMPRVRLKNWGWSMASVPRPMPLL